MSFNSFNKGKKEVKTVMTYQQEYKQHIANLHTT